MKLLKIIKYLKRRIENNSEEIEELREELSQTQDMLIQLIKEKSK